MTIIDIEAGLQPFPAQEGLAKAEIPAESPSRRSASKERDVNQEKEKDRKELDWDGPEDPDNPNNWNFSTKAFHTALPALYCFVIVIGTSIYVPAIPYIQAIWHVQHEVAVLPLSMYTLGLAVGPIITAPLSEIYGRRPVYLVSLILLMVFMAGASQAENIQTLIICRFFAGAGGSSPLAVGGGTVADIWGQGTKSGPAGLLFIMAPFLGTAFGTVAFSLTTLQNRLNRIGFLTGAYIIADFDANWRWSLYVVLIVAAPFVLISYFMKETSKRQILLSRRTQRCTAAPVLPIRLRLSSIHDSVRLGITRPLSMLFTEPLVSYLSIYTGFAFAMVFSFFGSYAYVYANVYRFNARQIGLCFLGLVPGFLLAVTTFGILDATLYRKAKVELNGRPAPEHRLYAAMLGSLMLPIALFWFAWSARSGVHWIVPVLAGLPFGWGNLMIFLSAITYLTDVYGAESGASAIAANGILRYLFGAAFPLFTTQMYDKLGIPWSGSVFAFISVAMMPIPWLFFVYGPKLRMRSSFETS
ncbi:MAG: hypothetical protein M1818_004509 [Claussenomyces sp. TS43310]|nr:MAG: hypothetical protein M1818_004509 [Claussenomyces sp. TS43310]